MLGVIGGVPRKTVTYLNLVMFDINMLGIYTAIEASRTRLTDEAFREKLPFVIREVEERGGHGYHGANAIGDVELSANYMRAHSEGYINRVVRRGFFHGLAQSLQLSPVFRLTSKGRERYEEYKAGETSGELEPNKYLYFLSD